MPRDPEEAVKALKEHYEASYLSIRLLPPGSHVHRTVDVVEGEVLVDLDVDGRVLGVERIGGQVDVDTLARVLRWAVAPR